MHIIDWIVKNTDPKGRKNLKYTGEPTKSSDPKGDNADLRHKVCLKCNRVWELNKRTQVTKNGTTNKIYTYRIEHVHYFEDMPTIGKVRKVCPLCKEKENECTD